MLLYCIASLVSAGYLGCYAVHCFQQGRPLAGVSVLLLTTLPLFCAVVLIFNS
ncbi:MAG: hypothetical protein RRZ24_06355 [Clostridia bacterium]